MRKYLLLFTAMSATLLSSAQVSESSFTAIDKNGKEINGKFAASPLTVKYDGYAEGMTFKLNGVEAEYNAETGLTVTAKTGSRANDKYEVVVYSSTGDSITGKTFTWIPTASSVSTLKNYEDGTEAILTMSNAKVTYASSDNKNVYIQDATRGILAYNLGLSFTAYKETAVNIWGTKETYKTGVVEFQKCDSTTLSAVTPGTKDVLPTAKTVAQTKLADNQLTYVKVSGAKIVLEGSTYYAVAGADSVVLYDSFKTGLLSSLEATPCFADVTGIISTHYGTVELVPTVLENVSDKIQGTCGTVSYTIDMDGNMLFFPTDGVSGTLAALGTAASKRPWSGVVTSVKTVKFQEGVATASDPSYMFKDMANLESVDFTNFNTADATTVKGFFQNCSSLKAADFSSLDLAKVTNFTQTFDNCRSLVTLDLRNVSTAAVSKASKADNMFANACMPDTLYLSKNFGKTADGSYVNLPTRMYMAIDENGDRVEGKDFDLPDDQAALYEYNESLENYGTYVPYQEPTGISTLSVNAESNAKDGKFMQNGHIVILKNGNQFNVAGQKMK